MADKLVTPLPQFEDFVTKVKDWMESAAQSSTGEAERSWCTIDIASLDEKGLTAHFDTSALGAEYLNSYPKLPKDTKPYAFLQMESDLIFAMHKSFAARHRGRLMKYRDACAQNKYHTFSALSIGMEKFKNAKKMAEVLRPSTNSLT